MTRTPRPSTRWQIGVLASIVACCLLAWRLSRLTIHWGPAELLVAALSALTAMVGAGLATRSAILLLSHQRAMLWTKGIPGALRSALRARRNPFWLAHAVCDFLFEDTYEWVIAPILSEGQLAAEEVRYRSRPRWLKAWLIVAKTYFTAANAACNAGLAWIVKIAIRVWRIG